MSRFMSKKNKIKEEEPVKEELVNENVTGEVSEDQSMESRNNFVQHTLYEVIRRNFLKMQADYNCYFFIADWHSLTTHPKPGDLHNNVRQVLAEYLACGIDPVV